MRGLRQPKNIITPPNPRLRNLFITGTLWDRSQDARNTFLKAWRRDATDLRGEAAAQARFKEARAYF